MKTIRIILLILIIIGIGLLVTEKIWVPKLVDRIISSENKKVSENQDHIIFPSGSEKLVVGKTYTLKWSGGPDTTQIFLIDTSLKSYGVSVSISDRVYNIKNTGLYDYLIPVNLKAGVYEFQIGNQTSNTFEIVLPGVQPPQENITLKDGRQCYIYNHEATATEPYTVNEFIDINISGSNVTGTKTGTQSGLDMTNGYSGTIVGTLADNTITDVFSYVIEGSPNKEKEIYQAGLTGIEKLRYPLIESGKMLVPDTTKEYKIMLYARVGCTASN